MCFSLLFVRSHIFRKEFSKFPVKTTLEQEHEKNKKRKQNILAAILYALTISLNPKNILRFK